MGRRIFRQMAWAILLLTLSGLFAGCGYKPMTVYTKKVLTGKIYADVDVYLRDPENAVLVKDALNEAIVSRFGARITKKKEATTRMKVAFKSVAFTPIQYDNNGYAVYYRATVTLDIHYESPKRKGDETVSGLFDFPIEPNAVISDAKRFEAIRYGAQKALDAFISRMAMRGEEL